MEETLEPQPRSWRRGPLDGLPVVPGANLLGHGYLFKDSRLRLPFLRRAATTAPVARVRFLHRWLMMVSSPEALREILVEQAGAFEKSPGIRILLQPLVGAGLFTSEGAHWKRQRRLMSPLFHHSQLASYGAAMASVTESSVARVADGEHLDLARLMTRITMGVVGATLFGADTFAAADEIGEALTIALGWVDENIATNVLTLQLTMLEALDRLPKRVPSPVEQLRRRISEMLETPVLIRSAHDPVLVNAIRKLDEHLHVMITDRRAHPQARVDLLTKLLLARDSEGPGDGMTDVEVRDEANTLFVAGHETTANALAWAFYLLARHPEARARVQAEADAFRPEHASAYDPGRLEYTTRVFKEALRLYPPVIVLGRRSIEPFTLAGKPYPRGIIAFGNPYGVHRHPEVWPEPDRFDPDRFLPEVEAARHKGAWVPFGIGPRVCIGNGFALMEGPIVMATILRAVTVEIDPTLRIEPDAFATLRPKGGVPAVIRTRA